MVLFFWSSWMEYICVRIVREYYIFDLHRSRCSSHLKGTGFTIYTFMKTDRHRKLWYIFKILQNKSPLQGVVGDFSGDPLGVRTRDPILKRDVLYLLS